jgi:hypothetical protein
MGGTSGDSEYLCMDYNDNSGLLVVGGFSASSDVTSGGSVPILVKYSMTTGAISLNMQLVSSSAS